MTCIECGQEFDGYEHRARRDGPVTGYRRYAAKLCGSQCERERRLRKNREAQRRRRSM